MSINNKNKRTELKIERLKELFEYDEHSGVFIRKNPIQGQKAGEIAGYRNPSGYQIIGIDYSIYFAHRLAWFYTHGEWPKVHIDHINGNPSDNRISNLRLATVSLNRENMRKPKSDNKCGFLGVRFNKGAYQSTITVKGQEIYLGRYKTPEEAYEVYVTAKREYHEGCTI